MRKDFTKKKFTPRNNWFSTVEIEVNSRCNRKCSYCPVSILPYPKVPKFMSKDLFTKIIMNLKSLDFIGRLSYHFYNEPLLRKDLSDLVSFTKSYLPSAYQVIYTNGDLLTDDRYNELIQSGIDLIFITSHSMKEFPVRPKQELHFPDELTLTNRGGSLQHLGEPAYSTKQLRCYAPSEMLIITSNGDVVLCYEDAKREHVMGNVQTNSIEEIWFSDKFKAIRHSLSTIGGRNQIDICSKCTNQAHIERGFSHITEP